LDAYVKHIRESDTLLISLEIEGMDMAITGFCGRDGRSQNAHPVSRYAHRKTQIHESDRGMSKTTHIEKKNEKKSK
jgi:hypothetical protein